MGLLDRFKPSPRYVRDLVQDRARSPRRRPRVGPSQPVPVPQVRRDTRFGGWANARTGLGGAQDKQVANAWGFAIGCDRSTLDNMYEFDAMSARIVDREADDALREGVDLTIPEQFVDPVGDELDRLGVLEAVGDARRWARLYGGGALILQVDDGQDPRLPINRATLRKLRGVYAADRYDVVPAIYDTRPGSNQFGTPLVYWVSDSAFGVTSVPVHRDRVIRFDGLRLPRRLRLQREGWGGSVIDRVFTAVANWSTGHLYTAQIVSEFTQGVYMLKGLAELLDSDDGEELAQRLEVIRMFQSVIGHIGLDADGEKFERQTTNVTGLSDLLERFTDYLVANTDMPRTVLLGEQPSGLNASADSEIRSWYDHVGAQRRRIYSHPIDRVLRLMMASPMGPTAGIVPEGKLFEWPDLWQPTDEEQANARKTHAEARAADVTANVISVEEARSDADLGDRYLLEDDPPPEPEGELEETGEEPLEAVGAPPANESLQDARTIGRRLGVSASSIVRMHRNGQIRGWKINNRWRFAWSEVVRAAAQIAS